VLLCEDESLIGCPFAIGEFVEGRAIQTRAELEDLGSAVIEPLAAELVATLAGLHQVDVEGIGLTSFGRLDGYAERQLRRWSGQWEIVGSPHLDRLAIPLIERLGEQVPVQQAASVVHGDFRIDNTILNGEPGGPLHVAAVVDWELSTIGDPVADVAVMCAYRDPAFDLIVGEPSAWTSPLLPGVADLATLYEKAGGARLVNWDFHLALAYFKVSVIAAGIDHRRRSGSGSGPGFDTAGQSVPIYLELATATLDGRHGEH
jgi:aminoglycoside phosphotransferase (APT) family kinase protein